MRSNDNQKWGVIHTVLAIILLICLISVFKHPFIYFQDISQALQLNNFEYSLILISLYCGNITSLFFGVYVNNLFKERYQGIASTFTFISGILSLLFCLISYFNTNSTSNNGSMMQIIVVIYGSMIAFLYKNSASIAYATVVGLCNEWSLQENRGANISRLQLSWSISTLLYIPIGFMLEYSFWYLPFLIFGIILIIYTFVINWGFYFPISSIDGGENIDDGASNKSGNIYKAVSDIASNITALSPEVEANIGDLKTVFNKQISLILLSIFFCSIAQGSFLITTTSFWMEDIYNLEASQVGLMTLSIFMAEIVGSIVMASISDVFGVFFCTFLAFTIEIISSLIILNCSAFIGPNIGGLWLAIILIFFLFVGWEIFFITQVLAMIEFGPISVSKNIILLSNFGIASIAKMVGAELSSLLWVNGHGLTLLSSIWLICNILGLGCYAVLYQIKDKRHPTNEYMPIGDGQGINDKDLEESLLNPPNTMSPPNSININNPNYNPNNSRNQPLL